MLWILKMSSRSVYETGALISFSGIVFKDSPEKPTGVTTGEPLVLLIFGMAARTTYL